MIPYNGKKIIFMKSDTAMLFGLDTIGEKIINFINKSAEEAEEKCNVKCSGYSLIFVPGVIMDIMMTFLLMSDNSAITLIGLPSRSEYGIDEKYIKEITDKIKEAVLNTKEEE